MREKERESVKESERDEERERESVCVSGGEREREGGGMQDLADKPDEGEEGEREAGEVRQNPKSHTVLLLHPASGCGVSSQRKY